MGIYYFFIGWCKISFERANAEAIINACMKHGIFYRNLIFSEDGKYVQFNCTYYSTQKLVNICRTNEIAINIAEMHGIPHILKKYKKRYGLFVGTVVMLTIVWLSRRYIWDIRVIGNNNVDDNSVIECLESQGLYIGSCINKLDIDTIENKVLIESAGISWIAINMKGNVAYVEIREKLEFHEDSNNTPANIVAKYDGQIEVIEANTGEARVITGQHVNKGELLISGIYDSLPLGYRYVRATGKVWAKTVHTLNIEIPFSYCEKVYIDEQVVENSIIFFSKRIKLFENTGFLGTTYDTIYKKSNLSLPGGIDLPITSQKTVHMYYEYQDKIRTIDEAARLAFEELDILIADIAGEDAEILRKNITYDTEGDLFKLKCTLVLKQNIAETIEFTVDN